MIDKKDTNYDAYRNPMTKEDYDIKFMDNPIQKIADDMKEALYDKYLVKCQVFQRDNFTCQNIACRKLNDKQLTVHHVKWQKNGGKDSARNCVLLCQECHANYHRGHFEIKFSNTAAKLPNHIKGHTFKLSHADEVNWKQIRNDMKKIRKQLKYSNNISKINWTMMEKMMLIFESWLREY
jgi:hypothetical protein